MWKVLPALVAHKHGQCAQHAGKAHAAEKAESGDDGNDWAEIETVVGMLLDHHRLDGNGLSGRRGIRRCR